MSRHLSNTIFLLCLIALLFSNVFTVKCYPDTTVNSHDCSAQTYDPNGAYGAEIDEILDDLTYMTPSQPQYQHSVTGDYATGSAYCQLNLSRDDCALCLEHASDYLKDNCEYSVSANVAMVDCGMSYDPLNIDPSPSAA